MVSYIRRGALFLPVLASIPVAVPFALPALTQGERGSPFQAVQLMMKANITDLAPVLKTTSNALQVTLTERGYQVASSNDTLEAIAAASHVSLMKVLVAAISMR